MDHHGFLPAAPWRDGRELAPAGMIEGFRQLAADPARGHAADAYSLP
ncbi:hypothetical protein [Kitasatospora nipponensis]